MVGVALFQSFADVRLKESVLLLLFLLFMFFLRLFDMLLVFFLGFISLPIGGSLCVRRIWFNY